MKLTACLINWSAGGAGALASADWVVEAAAAAGGCGAEEAPGSAARSHGLGLGGVGAAGGEAVSAGEAVAAGAEAAAAMSDIAGFCF